MFTHVVRLSRNSLAFAVCASLVLWGSERAMATPSTTQARASSIPGLLRPNNQLWSPEGLEDLLAPVALYPDEFIGHVLVASTNPQEVMDAGNWRVKNESLSGTTLDGAAKRAGFTPPVRMLIQNPMVLDMMCAEFGWTEELGQAYVNDQAGVLDAIQRLRAQARDAGNLRSSGEMLVETVNEGGHEVIALSSPDPNVVHVPQYDPDVVYTKLDDDDDDGGVSMTTTILTAALSFGGGLLVGKLFDDDDDDDWDDDDYYHPNYYGPPPPYYAHRPYYPVYPGYAPATVYAPPPSYAYGRESNVVVNKTVNKTVNNYWSRYDDTSYTRNGDRPVVSPITKARRARPELTTLNEEARRGPERRAPDVAAERNLYQTKKRETAARAERRKAMRAGERTENPNAGRPARPTLEPTVRPTRPALEPTAKPTRRAAGTARGEASTTPKVGATTPRTRERTGNRAGAATGANTAKPMRARNRAGTTTDGVKRDRAGMTTDGMTRNRTGTTTDGVTRTGTNKANRTPRRTGGDGGARRAEPPPATANPTTSTAGTDEGTAGTNAKGRGRRGAKGSSSRATNAPPQ